MLVINGSRTARHVTHPDATVNLEAVVDMLDYLVWVLRGNVCVCVCVLCAPRLAQ